MKTRLAIFALLLIPALVYGAPVEINPSAGSYNLLKSATSHIAANLQVIGIKLFFVLTLLQLVITGYGQVMAGEIEASLGKFAKAMIWVSFVLYLMTNQHASAFIGNTVQYFMNHAIGWAIPGNVTTRFDVNGIISTGLKALGHVDQAILKATAGAKDAVTGGSDGVLGMLNPFTIGDRADGMAKIIYAGAIQIIIVLTILLTCGYVALKIFMVKIEAALILAILPLSLAFLGLNAMRDQGFAPFKSMLALIYRIVILGAIVGGMAAVGSDIEKIANGDPNADIYELGLMMCFGFVILAFLAYKSDQIAASLASGSANLGSGDAVGGVMAGAAAGGIVGAAAGAATGSVKSMADVMKGLTGGGGGSIKNASTRGTGNTPIEPAPSRPLASMNSSSTAYSGDKPPQRSSSSSSSSNNSTSSSPSGTSSSPSGTSSSPSGTSSSPSGASSSPSGSTSESFNNGGSTRSQSMSADHAQSSTPIKASGRTGNLEGSGSGNAQPISPGSGENAGIGAPPQRDVANEVAKLVDVMSAPKKEKAMDKLSRNAGELGRREEQNSQATSVSLNTHHTD